MKREILFVAIIAAQAFSHVNGAEVPCTNFQGNYYDDPQGDPYPCGDGTTIPFDNPETIVYTPGELTGELIINFCCEFTCSEYKECSGDRERIDPDKANYVGFPSQLDDFNNCGCECAHGEIRDLGSHSTMQHIIYEGLFPSGNGENLIDCQSFPVEYIPELKDAISQNSDLGGDCLITT